MYWAVDRHHVLETRIFLPYIGNFRVGLIFAEFATSLKSPKIDTAKNKLYNKSPLRTLQIAKKALSENLTHLPGVIFAKFSRREKFPIYGISAQMDFLHQSS